MYNIYILYTYQNMIYLGNLGDTLTNKMDMMGAEDILSAGMYGFDWKWVMRPTTSGGYVTNRMGYEWI